LHGLQRAVNGKGKRAKEIKSDGMKERLREQIGEEEEFDRSH